MQYINDAIVNDNVSVVYFEHQGLYDTGQGGLVHELLYRRMVFRGVFGCLFLLSSRFVFVRCYSNWWGSDFEQV